jgi:hypothetical protein
MRIPGETTETSSRPARERRFDFTIMRDWQAGSWEQLRRLDRLYIRSNISGLYWSSLLAGCDSWLSMSSTNHCASFQPEWNMHRLTVLTILTCGPVQPRHGNLSSTSAAATAAVRRNRVRVPRGRRARRPCMFWKAAEERRSNGSWRRTNSQKDSLVRSILVSPRMSRLSMKHVFV